MHYRRMKIVAAITMAMSAVVAQAHMPYILPGLFDAGDRQSVAIEAAFTEDAFRPDIAMKDAPFEVTGPDGKTLPLPTPTIFDSMTVTEASLPTDGVYRLSSGQRLGRMGRMYEEDDIWKMVGEEGQAPAGAKLVDVQSTTLADAYVLRGKPGATGALAPRGKALEIHPLSDPTAFATDAPITFELLYAGKGVPDAPITLFREAGFYDGKRTVVDGRTDSAGRIQLSVTDAGRYLLLARHRIDAPQGATAPYYSYTVTLAFEVM